MIQGDYFRMLAGFGVSLMCGGMMFVVWANSTNGLKVAATGLVLFLGAGLGKIVWYR